MLTSTRTTVTTWASRIGALAVASVAGYASFRHITHVALMAGESAPVATVYPLAIDGLIVVGTMAMLADKANGRMPRTSARFALGFGIVATLAANIASAQPTVLARLVAAVPAAAFLLAVEVLARQGKLRPVDQLAEPDAAPVPIAVAVLEPVQVPSVPAPRPARRAAAGAVVRPSVAEQVVAVAAKHPGLSPAQVAARLGISDRTARRYMPKPDPVVVAGSERTPDRPEMAVELLELQPV
ncbi:hypothetical protein F4553_005355 [Allocatelliglobosispora scoriae]|uniref:DUF2637 domain-containing protein n=1 Tax=Allocatelliglobosispora scoriae TaxID=643052 RepID=A0A841BWT6_9ACTN|nr:DUF2637 domain-containing protein [Allocatelliglobosispora scoriae]MBB5871976.1 hypothetical protein [Allocatelliglobosispora scoriae]